jgi:hypothetical protein
VGESAEAFREEQMKPANAPFDCLEVEENVNVHALQTILDQWRN